MKGTKYMKQKRVSVMMIGATVLLALMAGCHNDQYTGHSEHARSRRL
jgi:hypothetical protein